MRRKCWQRFSIRLWLLLIKVYFGRYAGTEGNLKTEVVDVNLLEIPDPRHVAKAVAKKLQDAFAKLCQRDTRPMVEEEFMECHSSERAKKLAEKPVALPTELKMPDRRALDLAVFELLGVTDAKEREKLCAMSFITKPPHISGKSAWWKSRSRSSAQEPRAASSARMNSPPIYGTPCRPMKSSRLPNGSPRKSAAANRSPSQKDTPACQTPTIFWTPTRFFSSNPPGAKDNHALFPFHPVVTRKRF